MSDAVIEKEKIYALSRLRKIEYLSNLRVDHPNLQDVGERVVEFLHPFNDVSIISIAGVSGVGKTALVKELTPQLLESVDYERPGGIYFVEAPSAVARKMEISSVYDGVLAGLDAMTDKKYAIEEDDDRIRQLRRQAKKVEWRKKEMLRLLQLRKVLALAIDEAFHLLRFGDPHALLDTLKSIASDRCPKLILIGGGEMLEAMEGYAQVDLRSSNIYFPRYGATSGLPDDPHEHAEYHARERSGLRVVLEKLQARWPYEDAPDLCGQEEYFYKDCLGNMRIIKRQCERYALYQGGNKGRWDDGFFSDCEISINKIIRVKEEFEELEEKIRGSDDGYMALNPRIKVTYQDGQTTQASRASRTKRKSSRR